MSSNDAEHALPDIAGLFPQDGTASQPLTLRPSSQDPYPSSLNITEDDQQEDDIDDQDSADDDYDRDNFFTGPPTSWEGFTAEELELAASLGRIRANDLSTHLYNAHALKSRVYDKETASKAKAWESKQSWMKQDEDCNLPWHPERRWTAWPMSAEEVPRKEEIYGADSGLHNDAATLRKEEKWTPSGDMQEEITALMLRKAKQRLRKRKWVASNSRDSEEPVASRRSSSRERSGCESDTPAPTRVKTEPGTSPTPDFEGTSASADPNTHPDDRSAYPNILADDEDAARILQPSVRHILSKLDDLLLGLHRSRAGHRLAADQAADGVSSSKSRSRARKRKRVASGVVASAPPSPVVDETESDEGEDAARSESRPEVDRRRAGGEHGGEHPLAPRDWSELLATASLVGWDQSVVQRATQRCAALFGESVSSRIMPETAASEAKDQILHYRPDAIPDWDTDTEDEGAQSVDETSDGLHCPVVSCPRNQQQYGQRWRLQEHLRRIHGYTKDDIESLGVSTKFDEHNNEQKLADIEESTESAQTLGGIHRDGFMMPITLDIPDAQDSGEEEKAKPQASSRRGRGRPRKTQSSEEEDS